MSAASIQQWAPTEHMIANQNVKNSSVLSLNWNRGEGPTGSLDC